MPKKPHIKIYLISVILLSLVLASIITITLAGTCQPTLVQSNYSNAGRNNVGVGDPLYAEVGEIPKAMWSQPTKQGNLLLLFTTILWNRTGGDDYEVIAPPGWVLANRSDYAYNVSQLIFYQENAQTQFSPVTVAVKRIEGRVQVGPPNSAIVRPAVSQIILSEHNCIAIKNSLDKKTSNSGNSLIYSATLNSQTSQDKELYIAYVGSYYYIPPCNQTSGFSRIVPESQVGYGFPFHKISSTKEVVSFAAPFCNQDYSGQPPWVAQIVTFKAANF